MITEKQIQLLLSELIRAQDAAKNTKDLLTAIDRGIAADKGLPYEPREGQQ